MTVKLMSAGIRGLEAYPVEVEVYCAESFPGWNTVGLAETSVKESKERVLTALQSSGFDLSQNKVVLNLAPADQKKEGTAFDLPIALGLLCHSLPQLEEKLSSYMIAGELSLTGHLRGIHSILALGKLAKERGITRLIIPQENFEEASLISGLDILAPSHLLEITAYLLEGKAIPLIKAKAKLHIETKTIPDLSEVRGQSKAKRALEISAAGFHNLLLQGPPGSGKSMLAKRLPSILPPLSNDESLYLTQIKNLNKYQYIKTLEKNRPFRSPHHSISQAGLIGGGSHPKPGEVSLAHLGVLFLDELTEFSRSSLESLRQALEDHEVTISRSKMSLIFPSRFLMIAAMNPCPCGYYNPKDKLRCTCSYQSVQKYQSKISGPLLDRIDLQVKMEPVPLAFLQTRNLEPCLSSSSEVQKKIAISWERQKQRNPKAKHFLNAHISSKNLEKICAMSQQASLYLQDKLSGQQVSARSYVRIMKVARTIADLSQSEKISEEHLSEALKFRLDLHEENKIVLKGNRSL